MAESAADTGSKKDDQVKHGKMVGVARIELATPAMSTPAASAKLLIFCGSA
jgi:hypothetical protein